MGLGNGDHSEKLVNGSAVGRLREEPLLTGNWYMFRICSRRHRSFLTFEGISSMAVELFSPRRYSAKEFRSG